MSEISLIDTILSTRRLRDKFDRSGYIVSPLYDWVYFISSPILALLLGIVLVNSRFGDDIALFDFERSLMDFFIGAFIFAHLVIVVFRSHVNPKIFSLYPIRFTLVPLALFVSMVTSTWVLVVCSVLATFWDVYHSSMQTFGISRIYDARTGNDPFAGRRLDWILNLVLYAGPIAAGATLMDHVNDFDEFEQVGSIFFTSIPAHVESNAQVLRWAVIGASIFFILYYVYSYWVLSRKGYRISGQKVALLVSTAVCSVYAWGFNPFGIAFFTMNFFHALQYFAIVWWAEKGNMSKFFGFDGRSWAKPATFLLFLTFGFSYGLFSETADDSNTWLFSIFLVVSLMHFWYDGFIWSIVRKQI